MSVPGLPVVRHDPWMTFRHEGHLRMEYFGWAEAHGGFGGKFHAYEVVGVRRECCTRR